ncbi:MAG: cytochrome-c peroxidase [Bacteroidetes bacterium]|nr:cytochrome-c peroxidase [Bacteroidota bacterium]
MKFITLISFILFIAASAFIIHEEQLLPHLIQPEVPKGWPKPNNIFATNPLTEEGFQLGRKLFYDERLSKDGNFSCASCHQQFAAFATYDHDFSHGFNNQFTTRNAPSLQNLAWVPLYHWDGGVNHIEVQPLSPLTAPNEMAENIDSVLQKLRKDAVYKKMFKNAFGTELINSQRMLKALAQFTGSLVSANSKYDRFKNGQEKFNPSELHGYEVFKAKCATCHNEPLFTDNTFRNNGLPLNSFIKDFGRMRISNESKDSLKFRVPSLRNVGVTQPYMHDGRFYSLGQVIEHYRTGIQQSPTLDSSLREGIAFTKLEKYDLIIFLNTLTDTTFLKNKKYSAPDGNTPLVLSH